MAGGSGRGSKHPIPPTPAARRHCWVRGPQGGDHPGLVLAWEQRDGAWWAQVVYLVEEDGVLVQQWLAGDLLTPVGR